MSETGKAATYGSACRSEWTNDSERIRDIEGEEEKKGEKGDTKFAMLLCRRSSYKLQFISGIKE